MSVSPLTSISRKCKVCGGKIEDGDKIAVALMTDAFEPDAETRAELELPQDQILADMDWNAQDEMHVSCYDLVMKTCFAIDHVNEGVL